MPTQQNGHTFKQLSASGNNSLIKLGIANIVDKKTIPVLSFQYDQVLNYDFDVVLKLIS